MRFSLALLLTLVATLSVRADADVPVFFTPIPVQSFMLGSTPATIDLTTHFTLPGVDTAQIRQITTTQGNIFIELLPAAAPLTVANFLSYVDDGSYTNSLIHRSEPGFVVQSGGFKSTDLTAIPAKPAVVNEYNLPNTRGTIAMAKLGGDPDSATNQWFINLGDNSEALNESNNGGFTVFARALGKGMAVADAIAALPTDNLYERYLNSAFSAFETLPLADFLPGQSDVYFSNLVAVRSITAAPPLCPPADGSASILAFGVLSTNPAVVTAKVKNNMLTLVPGKVAGSARVIIRDINGNMDDVSFAVTVAAPAKITPMRQSVQAGQPATFTIIATEGSTYHWQRKPAGATTWFTLAETAPYSGTTGPTLTLAAATTTMSGDQFQCLVTIGAVTTARSGATLSVVPAPLAVQPAQKTYVAASVSLDLSGGTPGGLTYFASGLPTGLKLNPATGQISGMITAKSGTYTVTYWSQNGKLKSALQTVTFVIKSFPLPMVAAYETLLIDENSFPVGKIELNVTSTGAFTGRLTCGDVKVYALRGQLALNADYSAGVATLSIPRPAQPSSPFSLVLNVFNNTSFASELDSLDPNVTPVVVGSSAYTESVTVVPAKATGAPWQGTYTVTLGNPQNLDSTPLDAATTPAGIGYATNKIATNGMMSLKGKTADGTPFTASLASSYGSDYGTGYLATYRAYIKPYKAPNGYLAGWIYMVPREDSVTDSPVYHAYIPASSDFYWSKPPMPIDKSYREGFGPVGLTIGIEPWKSTVSLAGTYPLFISEAGLENSGGISDQLPVALTLSSTYAVTLAPPSNLANPDGWSLKINPSTGVFTGSFNVQRTVADKTVTLKVPVEGVVQQILDPAIISSIPIAQGFFLLPPNTTSGPTPISGRVELLTP